MGPARWPPLGAGSQAALNARDLGAGDEVLVGPYSFIATLSVIFLSGGSPIMVDTDRQTFLIKSGKLEEKVTPGPGGAARRACGLLAGSRFWYDSCGSLPSRLAGASRQAALPG